MKSASVKDPRYLVLNASETGIEVSLMPSADPQKTLAGRDDLIQAIAKTVAEGTRLGGIIVGGVAARFSESRSLATVASVLGYAWRAPAASSPKVVPDGASAAMLKKILDRGRWPLAPAYSGPPHITKPKTSR